MFTQPQVTCRVAGSAFQDTSKAVGVMNRVSSGSFQLPTKRKHGAKHAAHPSRHDAYTTLVSDSDMQLCIHVGVVLAFWCSMPLGMQSCSSGTSRFSKLWSPSSRAQSLAPATRPQHCAMHGSRKRACAAQQSPSALTHSAPTQCCAKLCNSRGLLRCRTTVGITWHKVCHGRHMPWKPWQTALASGAATLYAIGSCVIHGCHAVCHGCLWHIWWHHPITSL